MGITGAGLGERGPAGRQRGGPCASRRRPRAAQVITLVVRHLQQPAVVEAPECWNGVIISHRRHVSKLTVPVLCSLGDREHDEGCHGRRGRRPGV